MVRVLRGHPLHHARRGAAAVLGRPRRGVCLCAPGARRGYGGRGRGFQLHHQPLARKSRRRGLARQLLQPGWKRGTVHLVYAANMPSLWRLLLEHAWMAWLPALLALAAWLWMRTQRFGPRLPSPEPARRALLEHVDRKSVV